VQLVRAGSRDETQAHTGLPLGLLTTLMKDRRGDINLSIPIGGRLSDPRFDLRDTIWSAVRTVAINALTLPVSWIGHVRFTPDSRIQRIEIDPVTFEPGTATLTPQGVDQVGRLAAFLDQLPDARLTLTPIVSPGDAQELRRAKLEVAIDRAMRREKISREQATARLFTEKLPGQLIPDDPTARLNALLERWPLSTGELPGLGAERLDTVLAEAKRVGIDTERLAKGQVSDRDDGGSQVAIDVHEPEVPRPSKFREALRKLGVPLKPREATP